MVLLRSTEYHEGRVAVVLVFCFATGFGGSYRWRQAPACALEYVQFGTDVDVLKVQYFIVGDVLNVKDGEENVFHLIWYILIGLIAGVIAKSVMHVHITIFWTIVLGIIGSIIGGAVTHMFSRPTNERYHPAGLIFSTLGAILILFICYKLNIHFPTPNLAFR
jgi:uncharacterized membrane protein YeaQ/YmgE (transglycosylase-associated protein family)